MVTIVDYNLENTFGIVTDCTIKIKDQIIAPGKFSIDEIPEEIFKKVTVRKQFFVDKKTQQEVDVTEQQAEIKRLGDLRDYEGMFPTREDLANYEQAVEDFQLKYELKTIYEDTWVEEPINLVKKQFIEEKYSGFIQSDILIKTKHPQSEYKAVCTYFRDFGKMFRLVAKNYGFIEIEKDSDREKTHGLKFSLHANTPQEFSKCNGNYINGFKNFTPKAFEGSYEELKDRFEKDYKEIELYILSVKLKIEGKPLVNASDVLDKLSDIYDTLYNVYPMKSSKDKYSIVLSKVLSLKKAISESVLKENQ